MSISQSGPIRILLVDDHTIIRDGLRDLIASRQGMLVVGDAGTSNEALRIASEAQPDVIVLDLDLGAESGLELLPRLLDAAAGASVIILTGTRDVEQRDRAIELGAKGVVLKESGATELLSAIEKVHRTGEYWLEPGATKRLLGRRSSGQTDEPDPETLKINALTQTERELIHYIGEGLDNRQIAQRMHIAESTVRNNLSRIYDKLEIQGGRLGLLVYAYRHGLVKPAARAAN
ncbi:MAG TPA: response regulator transcription factor [Pyrinomonadaceae bacterium]|nr:response regulator transcription factor [Pyrinomonadaceae bacterium]